MSPNIVLLCMSPPLCYQIVLVLWCQLESSYHGFLRCRFWTGSCLSHFSLLPALHGAGRIPKQMRALRDESQIMAISQLTSRKSAQPDQEGEKWSNEREFHFCCLHSFTHLLIYSFIRLYKSVVFILLLLHPSIHLSIHPSSTSQRAHLFLRPLPSFISHMPL